jgi:hypothetical protein
MVCHARDASHAILAWWAPQISLERTQSEWSRLTTILRPEIRERMQLVVASSGSTFVLPSNPRGRDIAAALQRAAKRLEPSHAENDAARRGDRSYEVLKLLLGRWLRRQGPISIGELEAQSGLSYPTVAKQLRALGSAVARSSNRSAELHELPATAWAELTALAPRIRQTKALVDRSGRPPDLDRLVARLQRQRPAHVALGGVHAARHWQPDFDLDGAPRIDLEVHAPDGWADLQFVTKLDPAIGPSALNVAPILAVHVVTRAQSLFANEGARGVPWADPVEVLLDLHQLGLHPQADDFVKFWRRQR